MPSNLQFDPRLLGAGLVVAAAITGWGLYQALARPKAATSSASLTGAIGRGTLEDRVARIERKLQEIDIALTRLTSNPTSTNAAVANQRNNVIREADAEAMSVNPVEAAALRNQILANYEKEFRSQAPGTRWSRETTVRLLDKVDSDDVLSVTSALPVAQTVDCRAEMCRMSFTFPDASRATEWSDAYIATLGSNVNKAWASVVDHPDGSTQVIMYGFK